MQQCTHIEIHALAALEDDERWQAGELPMELNEEDQAELKQNEVCVCGQLKQFAYACTVSDKTK
jgi:hypothetical protein